MAVINAVTKLQHDPAPKQNPRSPSCSRRATGRTLHLLDKSTTTSHLADTTHLLLVLQHLVDVGFSVIVVEYNLELVKTPGWVIDLGPDQTTLYSRI